MKKNIISITGFSCAGKSTVIKDMINLYGVSVIRYADIHRKAIAKSDYDLGIKWVEDKGFDEYENGALKVFMEEMDKNGDKNIIIDGIFSYKCFCYLKQLKNVNLTNILLETTQENRIRRMIEREGYTRQEATRKLGDVDWLKYYSGLYQIINEADYVIDSGKDSKTINFEIAQIIYELQIGNDRI